MAPLILVVDDDEPIRQYAKLVLEQAGYEVVTACSGEDALRYLIMGRPDLLVMDLSMPGMSGLDLLARVRLRQRFKTLPAIVFSASALGVDIQAAVRAGAMGYLLKPFTAEELASKVAAVLAGSGPGHWAGSATAVRESSRC